MTRELSEMVIPAFRYILLSVRMPPQMLSIHRTQITNIAL